MAQETRSDFVVKLEGLLKSDDTPEALKVFSDSKNVSEIKNNSWELIPVITTFLTSYYEANKKEVFECCEKLINTVAENSNPEEALLQLIEEIEECTDDIKFLTLIKPLQTIILRIPKKRINSLAWGFNSIQSFLSRCDVPQNEKLVGKQKLLLDKNDRVLRIVNLYNELYFLYEKFISQLPNEPEELDEQKLLICKFLIELLGTPLIYMDMEIFNDVKSKARLITEKVVPNILKMNRDPVSLFKLSSEMKNGEIFTPNIMSTASLFYLIYHEHICVKQIPKVYNALYLFHHSLRLVNTLLDSDHYIVIEKGLKLSVSLLEHVKYVKLPYLMLDSEYHSHFVKALAKIVVYNDVDILRKLALQIYKDYLTRFETKGFYLLVYNLMCTLNHSGLIGFTITLYKDNLLTEFSKNTGLSEYFKGEKLTTLLKKFCFLHKNEETDLIEVSDQIIASLNLLRFLALRDKANLTEIWDYFKILEKTFLDPLRKGIDLSRAHYELKVKEVKEDIDVKPLDNTEISIVVAGQNLNELTKSEKLSVLQSSLTVFDMLESLLTRLLECIEYYYNKK